MGVALALHKSGREVAVFEAHPDSAQDIGAFLTLGSNGMRALMQLDAAEAVAAVGFRLTGMRLIDGTGAEIAQAPLGEYNHPLAAYRSLRRADLTSALQAEARRRGIEVRHGARLVSIAEPKDEPGVAAAFADGSVATGELLIGADGLNSVTRSLIDATAPGPRYAGQRVFYGYTSEAAPPSEPERIIFVRGSATAFGYMVSPAGETYWFARVTGEAASARQIAETTPAEWREYLVLLLRQDSTPAADIVAATSSELMLTNAWDLPLGLRWSTDRTLIIGDAAHAASPATGQGASMALEDAVVLAKALREAEHEAEHEADSIGTALATYERLRRPRVERNIVVSGQMTGEGSRNGGTSGNGGGGGRQLQAAGAPLNQGPQQRPAATDEELRRLLDWDSPLPG